MLAVTETGVRCAGGLPLGVRVYMVQGTPDNMKVTRAGDLALAEAILKGREGP